MFEFLNKRTFGEKFETFAATKVVDNGCIIVEKNFNCKLGEIDLILMDKGVLVFVEVRYRKQNSYGGAGASVDLKKQKKIIKAAQFYLQRNNISEKYVCRFDVFAIQGNPEKLEYNWIKNAFNA